MALVAGVVVAFMTGEPWPVAATLLAPPAVFGIVMGSAGREALALPALLLAAWWGADAHPRRAGIAAGLAASLSWIAAAAVPFVLLPVLRPESRRAALVATATVFTVVALPIAVLDVPAFVRAVRPGGGAPGVGIANLVLYRGLAFPGGSLVPLLAATAIGFRLWVRARAGAISHEGAAAAAVLLVLAAGTGRASPDVLWLPLVLLAVAGARAMATTADPSPR